jgi:bifunctional enzyme CysN/CysC
MLPMSTSQPAAAAAGRIARITIIGQEAGALGGRVRAALAAKGIAAEIDARRTGGTAGEPEVLWASDAALIVTGSAEGLTPEARRMVLLARYLVRSAPLLAVAGSGTSGPGVPALAHQWTRYAQGLGLPGAELLMLPEESDRAVQRLAEAVCAARGDAAPLRLWVERADQVRNGTLRLEGTGVSGTPTAGQVAVALPSAATGTISSVEPLAGPDRFALTLEATGAIVPGALLCDAAARAEMADQVAAEIVWTGVKPMLPGRPYVLRLGPQSVTAQVSALKHRVNPDNLDPIAARRLVRGDVGACNLSFAAPIVFDDGTHDRRLCQFELFDPLDNAHTGFGRIAFTLRRATNIHWQSLAVNKDERARLKGQAPCCLWFTGLSGSGKSTVSSLLEKRLAALGRHTYTLDGDNVRHGLNRDLGFTDADRVENIRRVSEVAKLFVDAGLIVMVSFISPFRAERRMARALFPASEFLEIYVDTPIEVCEQRDVKGLYRKARAGQLKNFTGIDSPYEAPEQADIRLAGGSAPAEALVDEIFRELERRGIVLAT